jgi:hypothetical protein
MRDDAAECVRQHSASQIIAKVSSSGTVRRASLCIQWLVSGVPVPAPLSPPASTQLDRWDADSSLTLVWLDMRTQSIARDLTTKHGNKFVLQVRTRCSVTRTTCLSLTIHCQSTCGLPIHPYFSALKIKWLFDNVPAGVLGPWSR